MAATDVLYRKQNVLNWVFAASSLVMLVTVVWMFADDFNRPYKKDQRVFRTVEEELNRRAVLALAPSETKEKEIVASEQEVVKARDLVKDVRKKADTAVKSMLPEKVKLETSVQNTKADYDAAVSYYNIAVEKANPQSDDAIKHRATFEKLWKDLEDKRLQVEQLNEKILQAEVGEYDVDGKKVSLPAAEKSLKELEAKHKKLTGEFDRFLKQTVLKSWGVTDSIRAMPVLDGFASPVKIKQSFHDDLPIDYGGFKYVTRYDRCTTCHLGIDKAGVDKSALTRLTMDPLQDERLQMECKNAQRVLEERQKQNKDSGQDINQLAARDLQPRQVKLSESQIAAFAAHPRLDLFVGPNSPHSMEKFGCTICHSGQGSGTSFIDSVHTPNDSPTMDHWKKSHDWKSIHFWDFPMLPSRFIESSCVKCHHQVESLIRDGDRNEAPKLTKGFELVRELGCFGCHEIQGMKGGRSVGPDMRLEPDPPLASLSPEERAKRLADTANPPGTYRKVGPSLQRISEKTNEEWTAKWIKAPRAFRPDTRMPHFYLQANNVPEVLPDDQKKFADLEIRAITHYLFGKSERHLQEISAAAKRTPEEVQADEKLIGELSILLAKGDDVPAGERKDARRKLNEAQARMAATGQPLPVAQSVTLPTAPADEAGKIAQRDRGRNFFATKGCMACHQHESMVTAGQTADGKPLPTMAGDAANFGPNLSHVAAKLTQHDQSGQSRKWLVQWLLDPKVHSPRTLMPVTQLTMAEADDISAWLLNQNPAPTAEWASVSVEPADAQTLKAMTRIYLRKAGMVTKEVEEVLRDGFSKEKLQYRAEDADEHELVAPLDDKKMLTYIGKKAIGNMGCFGCHNITGFENAKPIGVGLNDWGKKEVERIAYEDADNYVQQHYHIIDRWGDKSDEKHDDHAHEHKHGKPLEKFAPYPVTDETPYEKYFSEMMHHGHRQREGFLHLKLMSPRAYDFNRVRDWNDRARMPQFKFARTVRKADESDQDFQKRQGREEAEAREAVMTFVLGLIAEPVPPKFVYQPTPERAAEINGRRVLEQFNCNSCHMIRPGMYDLMLTDEIVKDKDGKPVMIEITEGEKTKQVPLTYRRAVLDRLSLVHTAYRADEESDPKERFFREHNAWGAKPPVPGADRMRAIGVLGVSTIDADGNTGPSLRLSNALSFVDADGSVKTIPANTTFGVPFLAGPMRELAPTFGGIFGLKLKEYLSAANPAVYGDPTPFGKIDDIAGQALNGYAALPPPLFHQGERVQPAWLYQFLLNPKPIRKIPPLQMPKFSLSDTDAQNLVNYFTAVNQLGNPGTGLEGPYAKVPQRDEQYLLARTKEYVARLKANNWFDNRVNEMKPLWARVAKEQLDSAERNLAAAKAANDAAKTTEAQKEVDALKSQIGANDFPAQKARWEEREAYVADAWKLVTYSGNLCITCHQVGPALPNEYRAPNLDIAWERLRPDWTERWIAYPQRLTPLASLMQPQHKPADAKKHFEDAKVFAGGPEEQVRAARDLLMMFNQVVDWPVVKFRVGPNAFGPTAAPPKP